MTQSLKMAIKSIAGNKLRAFLTMLGIIIGVMALVILVSLVNGTTKTVTDTISGLGSNLLTVSISDDKGTPISMEDLQEWTDESGIGKISPIVQERLTGKYGSTNDSIDVYGTTASYYDIQELSLLLGRFIRSSDVENHTNVCVINQATASDIVGYTDCLGEQISIDGTKYTVVGVLEEYDSSLTSVFGSDSMVAYIPYTSLIRLSATVSSDITSFYVSAEDDGNLETTQTKITSLLMERFDEDDEAFSVISQDELESAMDSVTSTLTLLLGGIAAISLLVGGIGIMNIMMVSVTERTREIGIRKAIGAHRAVILQQFLLEAVALCMIGCAIGIFMSWAVLQVISVVVATTSLTFSLQGNVVVIAVIFCLAIGIGFGLYPANKAAAMQPIDALHYGG